MLDLLDELLDLIGRFDAAGLPYAICGGLALAVHGYERATVGLNVAVQAADLERALAIALKRLRGSARDLEDLRQLVALGASDG